MYILKNHWRLIRISVCLSKYNHAKGSDLDFQKLDEQRMEYKWNIKQSLGVIVSSELEKKKKQQMVKGNVSQKNVP